MDTLHADAATVAPDWLMTVGIPLLWVVVLSFVFIECALILGLFLPGDSLLLGAGIVLAQQGAEGQAWALSGVALVVAVLGNQAGYAIGRKTGAHVVTRRDGKVLNRRNLERARLFFDRRGFFAVVAARYIPYVRTLTPPIAGAAGMNPVRFLVATVVGAVLWVPALVLVGYYGAGLLDAMPWLKNALMVASLSFFVGGTAYGLWRYRQEMRKPSDTAPQTTHT